VLAYAGVVIVCGLAWILIAIALRVHPVPTTFLSKIVTGEARLFSGGLFQETLPERLQMLFFRRHAVPGIVLYIYFAIVLAAAATLRARSAFAVAVLVVAGLMLRRAPGNYLWYSENLAILLVAICASIVLTDAGAIRAWMGARSWPTGLRAARSVVVASVLVLFVGTCFLRNRDMFWNLRAPHSRGLTYKTIGEHAGPEARFTFAELPRPVFLMMGEIGIAAYFGGASSWILDESGLAQPGELVRTSQHPLARFYPPSLKRTGVDELLAVVEKLSEPEGLLLRAYGDPGPADVAKLCEYYDPASGVCLQQISKVVRTETPPGTERSR
jgi:hypothetical protein